MRSLIQEGLDPLTRNWFYSQNESKVSSTPICQRQPQTPSRYESSSSSTTIEEVLSKADAPPQDLLFHIQGILMHPHQGDELYDDFSYFSERIRYLKLLLQEQKHRTIKEPLYNSRDRLQW